MMRIYILLSILFLSALFILSYAESISCDSKLQEGIPEVVIRAQTEEEAFDFLMFVAKRMPFYVKQGYSVGFPSHPEFQSLTSSKVELNEVKRADLKNLFKSLESTEF